MERIDMSATAITRRLRQVDQLRELCLVLAGPRLRRPWGVPVMQPGEHGREVVTLKDSNRVNNTSPAEEAS